MILTVLMTTIRSDSLTQWHGQVDKDDITDLLVHAREEDAQRAVMDAQLRKYDEILEVGVVVPSAHP